LAGVELTVEQPTGLEAIVLLLPLIALPQTVTSGLLSYHLRRLGFLARIALAAAVSYVSSVLLWSAFLIRVSQGGPDIDLTEPNWLYLASASAAGVFAGFRLRERKSPAPVGSGADPGQ
jgi:hypothetical protein